MTTIKDHFTDWLRDAHAMEKQALTMLNGQSNRITHYPQLKARIDQHYSETESQVAALESLFERYGEGRSIMKDLAGTVTAMGQAMGGMFAADEVVKGSLASYTFEHMEIASYRILIATAEQLGDMQAVATLKGILEQELAMAAWLEQHLAEVTQAYLTRDDSNLAAKR